MGYLVGRVCYETHAEATNHVMTHVVPTIHAGQQLIALLAAVSVFFVTLLYLFRAQILTVMFGHIEPDVMAATNTYYLFVMASIPGTQWKTPVMQTKESLFWLHAPF